MSVNTIASFVGEHDTRLWRVLHHYVDEARDKADYYNVRQVGMDETSHRRPESIKEAAYTIKRNWDGILCDGFSPTSPTASWRG